MVWYCIALYVPVYEIAKSSPVLLQTHWLIVKLAKAAMKVGAKIGKWAKGLKSRALSIFLVFRANFRKVDGIRKFVFFDSFI